MASWLACCFRCTAADASAGGKSLPQQRQSGRGLLVHADDRHGYSSTDDGTVAPLEPAAPLLLPQQATHTSWDLVALEATPHAVTVLALGGSCSGAVLYQNALSRSYFGNRCTADPAAGATGAVGGEAAARGGSSTPRARTALPAAVDTEPRHGGDIAAPSVGLPATLAAASHSGKAGGVASRNSEEGANAADANRGGWDADEVRELAALPPVLFELFSLCPEKLQALATQLLLLEPAATAGVAGGDARGGTKTWKGVVRVPACCSAASLDDRASAAVPTAVAGPVCRELPAPSLQPWAAGGGDACQPTSASATNVFSTDAAVRQTPSFTLLMPAQHGQGDQQPQQPAGSKGDQTVTVAVSAGAAATASTTTTAAPCTPSRHSAPLGHVPSSNFTGHLLPLPLPQHDTQGSITPTFYSPDNRHHDQHDYPSQPAQPHLHPQQLSLPAQALPASARQSANGGSLTHRQHSQQGYQHVSVTGMTSAHVSGVAGTSGAIVPVGLAASAAHNTASTSALSTALATSTIALTIEQQPGLASAIAHSLPLDARTEVQQIRAFATTSGMLSSGFSGPIAAASLENSQPLLLVGQPWEEQAPGGTARSRLLLPPTGSGGEVASSGFTGEHASGFREAAPTVRRGGSSDFSAKERILLPLSERLVPSGTPRTSLAGIPEIGSFQIGERGGTDSGRGAAKGTGSGADGQQVPAPDKDRFNSWIQCMMKVPLPDTSAAGAAGRVPYSQQHQQHPHQSQQPGMPRQEHEPLALWPYGGGSPGLAGPQLKLHARPPSFPGRAAAGGTSCQLPAPVVPRRSMNSIRGEMPAWDGATVGSRVNSRACSGVSAQWVDMGTHSFTAQQAPAAARAPAPYWGSPSCPLPRMPASMPSAAAASAMPASNLAVPGTGTPLHGSNSKQPHPAPQGRATRTSDGILAAADAPASGVSAGSSGRGGGGSGSGGMNGRRGRPRGTVGSGRVNGADVTLVRQALAPRMAAARGRRGSPFTASASQAAVASAALASGGGAAGTAGTALTTTTGSDIHDGIAISTTGELSNTTSECAVHESEHSMRASSKMSDLRLPVRSQNGVQASIGSRSSHGGSWDGYSSTQDIGVLPAEPRTRVASEVCTGGSGWRPFVESVPEAEPTVSIAADELDVACEARAGRDGRGSSDQLLRVGQLAQHRDSSASLTLSVGGSQAAVATAAATISISVGLAPHTVAGALPDLMTQSSGAARQPKPLVPTADEVPAGSTQAQPAAAASKTAVDAEPGVRAGVPPTALSTTTMWTAVAAATSAASAGEVTPPNLHMQLERVPRPVLLVDQPPAAGPKSSSSGGLCSPQGEPSLAVLRFTPADAALLTAALRSAGGRSGGTTVSGYGQGGPDAGVAAGNPLVSRMRAAGGSVGGRLDMMDRTSNGSGVGSGTGSGLGAGCTSSLFCATLNQFPSGGVGPAGMSTGGPVGTSISGSGPQRNRLLLASAMSTLDLRIQLTGTKVYAQDRLRALRHGSGTGSLSGESSQPGTPGLLSPLPTDPACRRPQPFAEEPLAPPLELKAGPRIPSMGYRRSDPSVLSDRRATVLGHGGAPLRQEVVSGTGSQTLLDGAMVASNTASAATNGALGVGPGELLGPVSVDVVAMAQQAAPPAIPHLAVLRAASGAEPSGGFVSAAGGQSAALGAAGRSGTGHTYHRIMATVQPEPSTGGRVLVIMQTDVSAKVAAESHAVLVAETQHRLLEQIYPHHVLAALMEQLVQQQNHTTQILQDAREAMVAAEAAAARAAAVADLEASRALFQPSGGQHYLRQLQQAQLQMSGQHAYSSAFFTSGTLDALEAHYSVNLPRAASEQAGSRLSRDAGSLSVTVTGAAHAAADAAEAAAADAEAAAAALRRLERRAGLTVQSPPAFTGHGELARFHPQVSVLFADIKGFTALCKDIDPEAVMRMLNDLFSRFDNLLDRYGLRKMDTIGDGYVVAGGLTRLESDGCGPTGGGAMGTQPPGPHAAAPDRRTAAAGDSTAAGADDTALAAEGAGAKASPSFTAQFSPPQAARAVFKFAQAMLRAAEKVRRPTTGQPVQIRIGIATGPVVSGVVGATKPKYSLFGDTVHTANRLEIAGEPGSIHVSSATYALLVGDSPHHHQDQPPRHQLLQHMDGGRWSSTAAGMQLRGGGPVEATFVWTPSA